MHMTHDNISDQLAEILCALLNAIPVFVSFMCLSALTVIILLLCPAPRRGHYQ